MLDSIIPDPDVDHKGKYLLTINISKFFLIQKKL